MKITGIRQRTLGLSPPGAPAMRNAGIAYGEMTASLVAVHTDQVDDGRPLVGLAMDSIGRYGHGSLLEERFAPRLLAAEPDTIAPGGMFDPVRAWEVVMANEKPGGHGERAGAVGLLDAALWDLAAKQAGVPLWRLIADRFNGGAHHPAVPVYASGGHYGAGGVGELVETVSAWREQGHTRFKIKIGGASLNEDRARVEAVQAIVGPGALAVDGNGAFDRETAAAYLTLAEDLDLAWVEEPAPPLDFDAHARLAAGTRAAIGTGENLFSADDTRNLLRHGGLRPARDLLQMDIALSYGLPEYLEMIGLAESAGWPRRAFVPHAGHFLAFHVVAGLELGLHECAPDDAQLFGGLPPDVTLADGAASLPGLPGVGIEGKANLYREFESLI